MSWLVLFLAGLFEIAWAYGLKQSLGFTRFWPTLATVIAMLVSLALLGIALKQLPMGTAYAVWTGIGAVGTVLLGVLFLGESLNGLKVLSLMLMVLGMLGLKWTTTG